MLLKELGFKSTAIMYSSTILAVALAGAAIAITPSGFTPSSSQDMTVAFGNTLAVNGKEMQKEGGNFESSQMA